MKVTSRRTWVAAIALTTVWLVGITLAASEPTTSAHASAARWSRVGDQTVARQATQAVAPIPTKGLAEEVFKNVQVLKGIPVDDFMQTMGLMSAALGFDCDSCHTHAGTDQVRWDEDSPTKRMARRMVTMVQTINKDNFGGRQMVTCFTCHRGRDFPIVTPSLDAWYGEPNQEFDDALASTPGGPTVDQILNKYLEAIGGAQKLATVKSYVAKGKSSGFGGFGGGGVVQVFAQLPDKRATYIQFPDDPGRGDNTRTYDGSAGWLTNPYAVVPKYELMGSELDGARIDAQLAFPAQIRQALTRLHVGPPTAIDDKNVQVVQGTSPKGTLVTLYFDEKSGLLVRVLRFGKSPIGRLPTQVDYADYRDVGGVNFPSKWTFSWLDGRDTFELSDIQLNVPIDAAKFGEPKPVAKTAK